MSAIMNENISESIDGVAIINNINNAILINNEIAK
jgi:hypothetical protein